MIRRGYVADTERLQEADSGSNADIHPHLVAPRPAFAIRDLQAWIIQELLSET